MEARDAKAEIKASNVKQLPIQPAGEAGGDGSGTVVTERSPERNQIRPGAPELQPGRPYLPPCLCCSAPIHPEGTPRIGEVDEPRRRRLGCWWGRRWRGSATNTGPR